MMEVTPNEQHRQTRITWLQKAINQHESMRDEIPFGLDEDDSNTLAALRIALASLEAEPVAWLWSNRKHPSEVTLVRPEDDDKAEAAQWSGWSYKALYASTPAPVSVPDEVNVLLNHLEDVLPDEAFNLIDVKTWNNVSMLSRPDVYRAAMLQDGGRKPLSTVTAKHRLVIEMLLNVCGAAFELADDSCQQDVDGEECHVIPNDSFEKLSDALDEIENTLPTDDIDRPDVFLAWSAMPRAALKSILQADNSPVILDDWVACSERMPEQFVEVLVCTEDGSRYVAALNQSMNWDDGDFFDDIQYVTHWMPLPAAPHHEVKP